MVRVSEMISVTAQALHMQNVSSRKWQVDES